MAMLFRLIVGVLFVFAPLAGAKADVKLSISYSETVDLFQTTDNMSLWWQGFTDERYRQELEDRFGWSEEDQKWVERYTEYRRRTYSDPSQGLDPANSPNGLFAASVSIAAKTDPLVDYLLAQPSIETAFRNFETIMPKADAEMLRGFYSHFERRWRQLLSESRPLIDQTAGFRS